MRKVKRASKILLYQRHRQPGIKGWELKRALGRDYMKIIQLLDEQLANLDLQVKIVYEEEEQLDKPTEDQLEKARFYVTIKEPIAMSDLSTSGWRVDDIAALVIAIAYIISKQGKSSRKEVEQILKEKFPKWKVEHNLSRFIARGYLSQDENDLLYLDWRTRAEIDQKELVRLILGEEMRIITSP
ncbi:MAG: hypothetical protein QG670_2151 [Thermoproteota archaeon]|nr:hypothetical protein [Thermoproteota archaeon]